MDLNDYLASQRPEDQKKVDEDHAEMNCRFFLRSVPGFEFIRPLPDIGLWPCFYFFKTLDNFPILIRLPFILAGCRAGKYHFLIRSKNEKRENRDQLLSLVIFLFFFFFLCFLPKSSMSHHTTHFHSPSFQRTRKTACFLSQRALGRL